MHPIVIDVRLVFLLKTSETTHAAVMMVNTMSWNKIWSSKDVSIK